jgi:uncharacterized membrane protein YkoI
MFICYSACRLFVADFRLECELPQGFHVSGEEKAMRTLSVSIITAILAGFIVSSAWARVDEQKVPLDKLPKACMDSVKAKFPAAELKGAAKETENGKTSYEVSLTFKNANIDVILTPEGKITAIERVIAASDLPMPVAQTVKSKYPQSTIKLAEELSDADDKINAYEVILVLADKKEVEVKIDPSGKILNVEKKEEEEGSKK